jgi:hypothetical protein
MLILHTQMESPVMFVTIRAFNRTLRLRVDHVALVERTDAGYSVYLKGPVALGPDEPPTSKFELTAEEAAPLNEYIDDLIARGL